MPADTSTDLPSYQELMRFDSTCVKGLPPTDTWDLSSLLIEGKPVERAVVVAWLEAVYARSLYDNGSLQQEENQQLDAVALLLFADAVGSRRRVIDACYQRCKPHFDTLSIALRDDLVSRESHKIHFTGRHYHHTEVLGVARGRVADAPYQGVARL